jgi:hypothetical protein
MPTADGSIPAPLPVEDDHALSGTPAGPEAAGAIDG